ncbi:MAG: prephenate dehydratase [Burkholderiaceae bacterium]|jgi:chorismate mutase/prephenate dehydratase|nr:prephenate dehydratase [Burkholderiaceae bacterium]
MSGNKPTDPAPAGIDPRLLKLRERIDAIDAQMLDLLNARGMCAREVGEIKRESDAPVYRPEREAQIFERLRALSKGPLPGAAIEAIYREVISACRALERRMRVAYLGPPGTFSEQAAHKHFGQGIDPLACATIDEAFRRTEAGDADFGVVPIENSTEGAISRTLDLLLESPLTVSGEISIPVRHCLMSLHGTLEGIERICAHPQALAQCSGWLDRNAPGVERVPASSNAEGARLAAADPKLAAIAGEPAARTYGLALIESGIQDSPGNRTRFVVIGTYQCAASGLDLTSLILSVPDRAGAVHRLIEPLARHGVSMKRFESRPARRGDWEYFFYVDLVGHKDDAAVAAALAEIRDQAAYFQIIGSYPRAS